MSDYENYCRAGDAADQLLSQKKFQEAEAAYHALLKGAHAADVLDSFLVAKTTLSLLRMHVESDDFVTAHQVLKAPEGSLLGQGIKFLGTGQTSVNDLMMFFLVVGHLHSLETDQSKAQAGVNHYLSMVGKYAVAEAPALVPAVVGNWIRHLEHIFQRPIDGIPSPEKAQLETLASSAGALELPTQIAYPAMSPWKRDWGSPSERNKVATRSRTPGMTTNERAPEDSRVESQIDRIVAAMKAQNFNEALQRVRTLKAQLLTESAAEPTNLGWVLFFEFKCLHALRDYQGALAQAEESVSAPYVMTTNNAAFRASVCAELALRCNRPIEDIVTHATHAYEERVRGGNPSHIAQSLNTAFVLLELKDAEDHAEFFARHLIDLGRTHGSDTTVIRGFLMLMRGALRAGRIDALRPLVDDIVVAIGPLEKSNKRADLMGEVSMLEATRPPLPSNRPKLERFLAK